MQSRILTRLQAVPRPIRRGAVAIGALLLLASAAPLALRLVPIPSNLFGPSPASLELTDRNGATLRDVRVDDHFAREVTLSDVPPNLVHAVLAAEDKRFYEHHGVDWLALGRAVVGNITHQRIRSGASTITQQLVKISNPRPRTLRTKLIEAVTALRLEQIWTKDQILAAYLNRLDFGNLNIGVGAAAHYYFGKPLSDLTDAEAAFLASVPKNPTRLNPYHAFPYAKKRQQLVLRRMHEDGWLAEDNYRRAREEELRLEPRRRDFRAPHFVDLVLHELQDPVFASAPLRSGGRIETTIDIDLQQVIERSVHDHLLSLRQQNVHHAAVVVIDNKSGDVLALVGSDDYFAPGSGQVNGATARRSPGSALKPFTYLLALERGATPSTVVADVPAQFVTSTGVYHPENFSQRCNGPVRYRFALANSLNIPAVRVLASIGGPAPLRERLQQWGITTLDRTADEYGLGLTIGNAEVRLTELTNAYAALARLGRYRPYRIARTPLIESKGPAVAQPTPAPLQAWLIADMLSDNEARVHSFGRESSLRFEFPVACKTGTSTDFRDNWAMGYTPEFTAGVWVGNFDGSPMQNVSGVTGAGPLLHDAVELLHAKHGSSWYARPPEIIEADVHPITGKRLLAGRRDAVRERFVKDTLPSMESPTDYDQDGKVILGPEYGEWLHSAQNSLAAEVAGAARIENLHLVTPAAGTTFVIDPDVPSSKRIPLVARGNGSVVWESDTLSCTEENGKTFALAVEGTHRLRARDSSTGKILETWVVVKAL